MGLEFSPKVRVLAQEDPATESDIEKVTSRFPSLPAEYIDIVRHATEIEVEFENGRYLRVWGPSGCLEMDEAYLISAQIAGSIPVGDDGGGHVIYYHKGKSGWGLYCNGYGNLDPDDAVWIAASLDQLLRHYQDPELLP